MKRKIEIVALIMMVFMVLSGCSVPDESSQGDEQNKIVASNVDVSTTTYGPYKLYVNGVDVFEGEDDIFAYTRYNLEKKTAHLPLFRILEALGATVEWEGDTVAKINYKGNNYIYERDGISVRLGDDVEIDPDNGIYGTSNYLIPAPGSTYSYCIPENNECYVSDSVILLFFKDHDITIRESYEGNLPIITING